MPKKSPEKKPPPVEAPEEASPPPNNKALFGMVAALSLLVLAAGSFFAYRSLYPPTTAPEATTVPAPTAASVPPVERKDAPVPAPAQEASPPTEMKDTRDTAKQPEIAALKVTQDSLQQDLARLHAELARLKTESATQHKALQELRALVTEQPQQFSMLVDFYRLEKQAEAGNPFEAELDAVLQRPLLPEQVHTPLAELRHLSRRGIPSPAQLKEAFAEAIADYLHQSALPADSDGAWWEETAANLSSLVKLRKIGQEHTGTDDESIIARSEQQLSRDAFAEAIEELSQLSGETLGVFSPWMERTMMRLETLQILSEARSVLFALSEPVANIASEDPAP